MEEYRSGEDSSQSRYLRLRLLSPLECVCNEVSLPGRQTNTEGDAYSFTLPNGEQLQMVPVPMELEVGFVREMNCRLLY